jgi:hypothetical protein
MMRLQVAWVYTVAVATLMGALVGATQRLLGSPGDLPEVVHQIHTQGRIPIRSAPSMFVCSAFSIAAGAASLVSFARVLSPPRMQPDWSSQCCPYSAPTRLWRPLHVDCFERW